MKSRSMKKLIRAKERIVRGTATPATVWEVRADGKGGFTRRAIDPKSFRRAQKTAWDKSIAATREHHKCVLRVCPTTSRLSK